MSKNYRLFTLPECSRCREVKAQLKAAGVAAVEVDLSDGEGLVAFRKIYREIKDRLPRDEDGTLPVPILLVEEAGAILHCVAQGSAAEIAKALE